LKIEKNTNSQSDPNDKYLIFYHL